MPTECGSCWCEDVVIVEMWLSRDPTEEPQLQCKHCIEEYDEAVRTDTLGETIPEFPAELRVKL